MEEHTFTVKVTAPSRAQAFGELEARIEPDEDYGEAYTCMIVGHD